MNQPTSQQINEAKAYIRMRVEAELSMRYNLNALLRMASQKLLSLSRKYKMSVKRVVNSDRTQIRRDVERIIDWLMFMIDLYVDTLSTANHEEDKDAIIPYVKRDQYGKGFHDRLSHYVSDFIKGKDKSRDPSKALALLTSHAVAEGWMFWLKMDAERKGMNGFFSFRGSSYPCGLCDSMVGYHPMEDYVGLWHPHCKCYFIFV